MKHINNFSVENTIKIVLHKTSWRWTTTDDEGMWAYMPRGMDLDGG